MKTVLFLPILFVCIASCRHSAPVTPVERADTTGHHFTWTQEMLGRGLLRDIALVNDTLAYAVGEIYLPDSTGQLDPLLYNLAIWDGKKWTVSRLAYIDGGYPDYSEIYWVFAISADDIWFGNSVHWNGHSFHNVDIGTSIFYGIGANKMWGSPTGKLYVVGNSGRIAYSSDHGASWQKVESGTTLRLFDVWGAWNGLSYDWEVLAIASSSQTTENALLQILSNGTVQRLDTVGLSFFSTGIWFVPTKQYYVVGSGIHHKMALSEPLWRVYPPGEVTSYGSSAVSGRGQNDVFVVGSSLEVAHYNGSTWYNYRNDIPVSAGALGAVQIRDNTVVVVGYQGQEAIAIVGRR